jgi:hypothetical protein
MAHILVAAAIAFMGVQVLVSEPALEEFLATAYAPVHTTDQIPDSVLRPLLDRFEEQISHLEDPSFSATLADPGEKFYSGCIVGDPEVPRRRLVLAGESGSSWFVIYEHGGVGFHYHFVLLRAEGKRAKIEFASRFTQDVRTIRDVKTIVAGGELDNETEDGYW